MAIFKPLSLALVAAFGIAAFPAHAVKPGQSSDEMLFKMIDAAKQAAEKTPDEAAKIAAFIATLETYREAYKEALMEDCLFIEGVEKAGGCSCVVEGDDYARTFNFWAKYHLKDEVDTAERDAMWKAAAELRKSCGLPVAE